MLIVLGERVFVFYKIVFMIGDLLNFGDCILLVVFLYVYGEYLVLIFWGDCLDSFYMFWF